MVVLKLDLSNILHIFNKGNITKTYKKMYDMARELAGQDMGRHSNEIMNKIQTATMYGKGKNWDNETWIQLNHDMWNYGNERMKFHMNNLEKLLILSLKQSKK